MAPPKPNVVVPPLLPPRGVCSASQMCAPTIDCATKMAAAAVVVIVIANVMEEEEAKKEAKEETRIPQRRRRMMTTTMPSFLRSAGRS